MSERIERLLVCAVCDGYGHDVGSVPHSRDCPGLTLIEFVPKSSHSAPVVNEYRSELHRAIGLAQSLTDLPDAYVDPNGVEAVAAEIVALLEALAEHREEGES